MLHEVLISHFLVTYGLLEKWPSNLINGDTDTAIHIRNKILALFLFDTSIPEESYLDKCWGRYGVDMDVKDVLVRDSVCSLLIA